MLNVKYKITFTVYSTMIVYYCLAQVEGNAAYYQLKGIQLEELLLLE